ncbi:MAG: LacI family DNA-binding transcriptional regulator [Anaerolineae bacterium]|nr:LacI family DNA-binding transcriptional regulator [Anaerolineae bacterium]
MKKKPTIRDVAKAAGVSVATVSRILNDKPDVSEETRQHVLATIDQLGYARSTQWQQLTTGKSRVISLHYPQKTAVLSPVSFDFVTGASSACEENDYSLHLITQSLKESTLLDLYRTNQCDGMILMEIRLDDWRVELLRQHQLPFVTIGHGSNNEGVDFIDFDFFNSVIIAFEHLLSLSHENIGFISIKPDPQRKRYGPAIRADEGYKQVCAKYYLPEFYDEVNSGLENVKEATINMLKAHPEISAIVSVSDSAIAGIFEAIHTLGLNIPDDISVIGLTGEQGAELTTPSLTSLQFPSWSMGYDAGKMLIDKLSGKTTTVLQTLVAPKLYIRASTGPVKIKI